MKTFTALGLALGLALGIGMGGEAAAQVKFAVAGPITGPNAAFGAQLKNGAEMAIADINASGGILGQKITLQTGDISKNLRTMRRAAAEDADEKVLHHGGKEDTEEIRISSYPRMNLSLRPRTCHAITSDVADSATAPSTLPTGATPVNLPGVSGAPPSTFWFTA